MNKVRLLELVQDPSKIQDKDLKQLVDLSKQHPYSQVLHILAAKAHHSLEHPNTDLSIQKAAIYCWDRKLLKHIIEDTLDEIPIAPIVKEPPVVEAETPTAEAPPWEEELELDLDQEEPTNFDWIEEQSLEENIHETSEELAANLEQESKEAVEGLEPESNSNFILEDPIDNPASTAEDEASLSSEIEDSLNESVALEASTEETETVNDLPTATEEADSDTVSMPPEPPVQEPDDDLIPDEPDAAEKDLLDLQIDAEIQGSGIHDELMQNLDRLRQSREEYQNPQDEAEEPLAEESMTGEAKEANAVAENPETSDTKSRHQQIEIIDTFIKNSPVLSKPNLSADSEATSQKDLSKRSVTFSDELITEQLAKIMIRQGSDKEAIKIYKKLMVKIPKKKSYFASQIENLSKK